jgi:HD-GYP domain-containing protein (c-di-GMP phosphodiesterase class II)
MAPEKDGQIGVAAKDVVNQLAVIIRTAQIHNPTNVAVLSSIEKFVSMLNRLIWEAGSVELELVGDYFYLNEDRVRFSVEYLLNFDFLQREFKGRSLGRVHFLCGLKPEDMQHFVAAFLAAPHRPDPFESLSHALEPVKCIEVGGLRRIAEEAEHDIRRTVKRTYFNAVSFSKGVMKKLRAGEKVNIRRAKRIVESMVDLLLQQEDLLLGMTAIKNYDDYTFHHSVNVSILSIALGQRLGLSKRALMELGMVALFHDIGKTEIPPEVLNKPSNFTDEEWRIVRRHPFWGVKAVFKMKGVDATTIRAAIVAYEHHIHHDKTGYPRVRRLSDLDLFSRIVSIADQYDGMTSSRVYARVPMSPDRALSLMMKRTGSQLDPLLMKFFINMVGFYPVGSLVVLDSKELAVVCGTNPAHPLRPKVLIITDPRGNKLQEPRMADLTLKNPQGEYSLSIVKSLDITRYRVNLAEYLL